MTVCRDLSKPSVSGSSWFPLTSVVGNNTMFTVTSKSVMSTYTRLEASRMSKDGTVMILWCLMSGSSFHAVLTESEMNSCCCLCDVYRHSVIVLVVLLCAAEDRMILV